MKPGASHASNHDRRRLPHRPLCSRSLVLFKLLLLVDRQRAASTLNRLSFPADWQRIVEPTIVFDDKSLNVIIEEEAAVPCDKPVTGLPSHTVSCEPNGIVGRGFARADQCKAVLNCSPARHLSRVTDAPLSVGVYIPFLASILSTTGDYFKKTRVLLPVSGIRNISTQVLDPVLRLGRAVLTSWNSQRPPHLVPRLLLSNPTH
jgi:hypothetical protein